MSTIVMKEEADKALAWLVADPVRFAEGVLRHNLWDKQKAILSALASKPSCRVAVKACHASSKTFTAAEALLWWLARYSNGTVVTTAPTWTQVEKLLWGEVHKAVASAAPVQFGQLNKTELIVNRDRDNYAIGLSTNEGVRFQGFHGQVLLILDEAPGVIGDIWESIEGIRAGGDVRILALGNPVIASGPFYDAFTKHRGDWLTFTINAFDTPNLQGVTLDQLLEMEEADLDVTVCPYLVKRRWVREKHREWGPRHPLWASRVLGDFPEQAEDALISLAWLEQGKLRELPVDPAMQYTAGVDVAGPGEDETVLCVRQGGKVISMQGWYDPDPRGSVIAALAPYKDKLDAVNVDSIGIGYNFATHLRDQGLPVSFINVGESPNDREKYKNLKAELYWGLRMRCESGDFAGLTDEMTIGQLAGIRYEHNARGQVVIESKDDLKKRGVSSPDRAEAVMLAFAPKQGSAGTLKVVGY